MPRGVVLGLGRLGGDPSVAVRGAAELDEVALDAALQAEVLGAEPAHGSVRVAGPAEERGDGGGLYGRRGRGGGRG